MKTSEIRQMTPAKRGSALKNAQRSLAVKKFHVKTGQDKNSAAIKTLRTDIARIHTVNREQEITNLAA